MKKLLMLASVAIIGVTAMANAFDLRINGQPLEGVSGSSFTFNGGSLDVTATGYTDTNDVEDTVEDTVENNITIGEAVPFRTMNNTVRFDKVIWVPADRKILAQSFHTIDSKTSYGQFVYHIVAGNSYNPPLNFWVSVSPGGEAISPQCYYPRGRDASTLVWTHFKSSRCVLEPDTAYYLNVQSDEQGPRSKIERWIRVLRL